MKTAKSAGVAQGLGRRKRAVSQVRLSLAPTVRTVNGMALASYFSTVAQQVVVLSPLRITSQDAVYGFDIRVAGGGKSGQADAARLGLARALLTADVTRRKQLKDQALLTRDARVKERKKPGLKRARRAPQFSKR